MESLNSYISDGESDSSPCNAVAKQSLPCSDEVDANCEPITMDMSEDSCSEPSEENDAKSKKAETKRSYSKSLSPSPATSSSSRDSSPRSKKNSGEIRSSSERSKRDSSKDRRRDEERRRDNYERSRKRDDDRCRKSRRDRTRDRSRDRNRDRDTDRRSKLYDSRRSNRSRSRSSSHSKHRSSKHKRRSRSRSRSYDRHYRKRSPRDDRHRRRSPYRSRRSRSKSKSKEKSKPHEWKPSAKLKVLEKLGIELKVPAAVIDVPQPGSVLLASENNAQLTPQLLLQKTMEEHVEKVKSATGIQLPSYYNPMAVNPTKYAEQIQKRRLLWGNKGKETQTTATKEVNGSAAAPQQSKGSGTIWKGATFGDDEDGKMTAKFQRLMGIKNAGAAPANNEPKVAGTDLIKKQEEMFHSMESQYEVARLATHSHRGLGLGFGTFQPR